MEYMNKIELLIATKNAGKIREIQQLLGDLPVTLRSLNDFPAVSEPEENGQTFAENAALKARFYSQHANMWSLADDSGLEVEALGGAPGIFSARYAGENASDAVRIDKLLSELDDSGNENRRARFVCSMAVADEKGEIRFIAEGACNGTITTQSRGKNGFGYDPVFVPEGFAETFGELSGAIKQQISHRARAVNKIIEYLRGFIAA
jgi:XTP/dITP diphosphohydrolase